MNTCMKSRARVTPSNIALPHGIYHDRIVTAGGRTAVGEWRSNIIVDRCRHLLAGFMQGKRGEAVGIRRLFIGRGLADWDENMPPPERTLQQLVDPSPFEVKIRSKDIFYLDATGKPTEEPTASIQITVTLGQDTPPIEVGQDAYPLREFGLFGKLREVYYMIDYVRHPVIHKQSGDTLVRTIRLVF